MNDHLIKVVVVDDSGLMRLLISDIVNTADDMTVIATAENGQKAVEVVCDLRPDVVLMDLNMDDFDGLYGIENILKQCDVPIIILSSVGNTDLDKVMKGLSLGAFDYLNKPKNRQSAIRTIDKEIHGKIRAAKLSNRVLAHSRRQLQNTNNHTFDLDLAYDVVVIGSSTGGTTAVEKILTKLPGNFPIPVIIAQHMPLKFIPAFAKRLNDLTPLDVRIPELGERMMSSGVVYILSGEHNTVLKKGLGRLIVFDKIDQKFKEFNHPSVDAIMLSVGKIFKERSIGVILTGMGKDGADGMAEIYGSGGMTLAQNEKSSVVYGMPKEVVNRGNAKAILAIDEISGYIVSCLS